MAVFFLMEKQLVNKTLHYLSPSSCPSQTESSTPDALLVPDSLQLKVIPIHLFIGLSLPQDCR